MSLLFLWLWSIPMRWCKCVLCLLTWGGKSGTESRPGSCSEGFFQPLLPSQRCVPWQRYADVGCFTLINAQLWSHESWICNHLILELALVFFAPSAYWICNMHVRLVLQFNPLQIYKVEFLKWTSLSDPLRWILWKIHIATPIDVVKLQHRALVTSFICDVCLRKRKSWALYNQGRSYTPPSMST